MSVKKRANFVGSIQAEHVEETLRSMVLDARYNTESSYSANTTNYPDNVMPFVDKHMKYLTEHHNVEIEHYLSNLRLMCRLK